MARVSQISYQPSADHLSARSDKSRYFAQPRPIIVKYLQFSLLQLQLLQLQLPLLKVTAIALSNLRNIK